MSNLPEDIDQFFTENIDNIDVKYNPAHWDKLQLALESTAPVSEPSRVLKAALNIKKILFFAIPSVAIVAIGIYYLSNKNQFNKPRTNDTQPDSTKENLIKTDTFKSPATNKYNFDNSTTQAESAPLKYNKGVQPDSNKKATQPILFFSVEKDSVIHSLKKDSLHTSIKDTVNERKKKKTDPFW